jgi:hypothetical protein
VCGEPTPMSGKRGLPRFAGVAGAIDVPPRRQR